MNYTNPDDYRLLIQQAANNAKKKDLEARYGMDFSQEMPMLPPDVESEWLDYLEEFEYQLEHAERIPLRKYIGDPYVTPISVLLPSQIENELERILDIMAANNVYIDFVTDVDSVEAYRFITEELLDEEVDDIRIEGMNQHFIYEEFHPDDVDWFDDDFGDSDFDDDFDDDIWLYDDDRDLF